MGYKEQEGWEDFHPHTCGRRGHRGCHPHGEGEGPEREFPWPEDDLTGMILRCGHHLMHRTGHGGRGQMKILKMLQERGSVSQKDLQEALEVQSGSMSEILSKLEGRGLIIREKDESDRHKSVISLTEDGRELLVRNSPEEREQRERELYKSLSDEEQQELKSLLGKLLDTWRAERFPQKEDKEEPRGRKDVDK